MEEQIPGQMELLDYLSDLEKDSAEDFDILNFIPVGSRNAVKRKFLNSLTGLKDRNMRDRLHDVRMKIPIINLQNGKGYFIPDMNRKEDVVLLIRWVKQEKSRIRENQIIVETAEKTLRNCGIETEEGL